MLSGLSITLIISFAILFALFIYLLVKPKKQKQLTSRLTDSDQPDQGNGDWIYLIVIGVIIVLIVGFYFTFKRYDVAIEGIKSDHPGVSIAALSPEIGEGVADVIQSFRY